MYSYFSRRILNSLLVGSAIPTSHGQERARSDSRRGASLEEKEANRSDWEIHPNGTSSVEPKLRIRTPGPAGLFLLYEISAKRNGEAWPDGYLAVWSDFQTSEVYVYDRMIGSPPEIGAALGRLAADFSVGVETLTGGIVAQNESATALSGIISSGATNSGSADGIRRK